MLGVNEATAFIDGKVKFNWFKFMKNLVRAKVPKDKKTRDAIFKHINTWIRLEMAPPSAELYSALPDKYKQEVNLYTFKVWDQNLPTETVTHEQHPSQWYCHSIS